MTYKLLISEAAENDIFAAMLWYENQREGLSIDFELCLDAAFSYLEKNRICFRKNTKKRGQCFLINFLTAYII